MMRHDVNDGRELIGRLCDLQIPSDIKISPDGEKVLYSTSLTWGHLKGDVPVTTLWLADWGEANSSKHITDGKYRDHSLAWHPTGHQFAFISDRAGNATKSAIYVMSLSELGTAVPITPIENEQAIEKIRFSPDGKQIAFMSKDEKTERDRQREKQKEDVQVWGQDPKYSRLRVINLDTKDTKTLSMDRQVMDFCWSPAAVDGSDKYEIAFVTCEKTLLEHAYRFGTDIHIVDSDLRQPRKVCSFPNRANELSWASKDCEYGEGLYFWSGAPTDRNFSANAMYQVNAQEGSGQPKRVFLKDNQEPMTVQSKNGHTTAKTQHRLEDRVTCIAMGDLYICNQDIEAYDVSFGPNDTRVRLAIATSDINNPVEVYSTEANSNEKVQLSNHGESLRGQRFGTCTVLSCPTTDHHELVIDALYLEPTASDDRPARKRPHPTIVLIHGGPYMRLTNAFNTLFYMWTPYLLRLGYGILLPNFRGSSSRGEEYTSFSYQGVGFHAYADIIDLTQHAIEQGYADPDRLVVGGYSHGGLLANICALRNGSHGHRWRFKAAIAGASISDFDTMSLTSDMGSSYPAELHNGDSPWNMSIDDVSTRQASVLWAFKKVMERSQREGVSIVPPMLILHGANDERCHVAQAWGMRRALEYYSLPFEMAIYPRQGHIFHEQNFWIDMALRIGVWVERHIGPAR